MDYPQTLDYLFRQLPMYQRVGKAAYKKDIHSTIALCSYLDNPQNAFPSIHIAGTNGKGSVAHMIASVLQESGYKTGLYTSPHFKDFRERIKINGKEIPKTSVTSFVNKHRQVVEDLKLSFFEWTLGLCLNFFASESVDIAVVETGMGGRLDSTNVITPLLSVITGIGLDHTDYLGNDIESIAREKAGIIKKNVPVIVGEVSDATIKMITKTAKNMNARIIIPNYSSEIQYKSDLNGSFQMKNIKVLIAVVEVLKQLGWKIDEQHLSDGLLHVVHNTGIIGRWQILDNKPLTICDMGHNENAWQELTKIIDSINCIKKHLVIGMVSDKKHNNILNLMPRDADYYFCNAAIPRALYAEELKMMANKFGLKGNAYPSVSDAFKAARQKANEDDFVFVGGSAFVVAEVI